MVKMCVIKLCVKDDGVSQMVRGTGCVSQSWNKWSVTKLCVKGGVKESGCAFFFVCGKAVWNKTCAKFLCQKWCVTKVVVTKGCVCIS